MNEDTELLRAVCRDNIAATNAELLSLWIETIRSQEIERLRNILSMQQASLAESKAAMRYAIALYRTTPEGMRVNTWEARFTERELGEYAQENKLDARKLIQVAIGDRESYQGYIQGPLLRFTYGKRYVRPDTDSHPSDNVPAPEKVGARGMFRLGVARNQEDREND